MRSIADEMSWRRFMQVALVCLILSTQVLFQQGLFESWSLERVARGWFDFFAEILLCGVAMWIAVTCVQRGVKGHGWVRAAASLAALAAGALAGYSVALLWLQPAGFYPPLPTMAGDALRWAIFGSLVFFAHSHLVRATRSSAALEEATIERAGLDRQMIEAQLQILQAQIEPHFLFNTLAHVKRLYGRQPGTGGEMMSSLRLYLRAALPQMREARSTLDREVDLVKAYLSVLRIRLGSRLEFSVSIPEGLRGHAVPPMILITLVENAIKHGIGPLPEGGTVAIRASVRGDSLEVFVADTGMGFQGSSGSGVGLANIRARLKGLYGRGASLSLEPNTPRGVVACIRVPHEAAAGSGEQA